MRYLPKSPADRAAMLKAIGVGSIDDLFSPIPLEYRLNRDLKVLRQMVESEIVDWFCERFGENRQRLHERRLDRSGRSRDHGRPPYPTTLGLSGAQRASPVPRSTGHLLLSSGNAADNAAVWRQWNATSEVAGKRNHRGHRMPSGA